MTTACAVLNIIMASAVSAHRCRLAQHTLSIVADSVLGHFRFPTDSDKQSSNPALVYAVVACADSSV